MTSRTTFTSSSPPSISSASLPQQLSPSFPAPPHSLTNEQHSTMRFRGSNVGFTGNSKQVKLNSTMQSKVLPVLKEIATFLVCGLIIYQSDLINVMLYSTKIYRNLLLISILCHCVMVCIGLYLSWFVGCVGCVSAYEVEADTDNNSAAIAARKKKYSWNVTHQRHIQVATAAVCAGSLLWMISISPVFHFWTIPLGIVILFFVFSGLALLPDKVCGINRGSNTSNTSINSVRTSDVIGSRGGENFSTNVNNNFCDMSTPINYGDNNNSSNNNNNSSSGGSIETYTNIAKAVIEANCGSGGVEPKKED